MKDKTGRAARKAGSIVEPKPPFPKQHQTAPGLESKLKPRPRFEAEAYKAAGKLQGKSALITGGDSGIGRAVAWLYAREGAHVAITYLPEEQSDADETKRIVESAGTRCLQADGAPGATREARAGLRVSGFKRRLFLHHRHGAAGDGRRNNRRLISALAL
jgi:hypothetical protein